MARVVSEPDRGIYDAMNKGLKLADGEVVGFINSDDFYASPDALAEIAKVFADPEVDACYAELIYVKRNDTNAAVRYWSSSTFRSGRFRRGWVPRIRPFLHESVSTIAWAASICGLSSPPILS